MTQTIEVHAPRAQTTGRQQAMPVTIILATTSALALRFQGSGHQCVGKAGIDEGYGYAGLANRC